MRFFAAPIPFGPNTRPSIDGPMSAFEINHRECLKKDDYATIRRIYFATWPRGRSNHRLQSSRVAVTRAFATKFAVQIGTVL